MKPKTNKTKVTKTNKSKPAKTFTVFCLEGTYFSDHFEVIDTSNFTAADWQTIENCNDSERQLTALSIAYLRNNF